VRRRRFIALLGGAAAWPLAAGAQQPAMPVVGFLSSGSPDASAERMRPFHQGLSESGYVEGRNVAIEYRWADGYDRLPAMAADLVHRQVAAIVAIGGIPAARAAKAATTTIPIVFAVGADPVAIGLVPSLNRPGGNLTGVTNFNLELGQKRLELLHEVVPGATVIALLVNPNTPLAEPLSADLQAAARSFGLQVHVLQARTEHDIEDAFTTLVQLRADALVIGADAYFASRRKQLAALAVRHALPTVGSFRDFAEAGGLMSYGGSLSDQFRSIGVYAGRILAGQKPADLPVQQSTKVELIINLKAAKALGLNVPVTLLGRADEVIE
jgi:putative ABC transport system substrate-binding protein